MNYLMILMILVLGNFAPVLVAESNINTTYILPQDTGAYIRTVKSIAYKSNLNDTLAQIELTDGTLWNFTIKPHQDYLLADLDNLFNIDTKIYIHTVVGTPMYWLCNTRFSMYHSERWIVGKDIIPVGMTKETRLMFPVIIKVEKILVSEGWLWNDYVYRINLSDGSIWDVSLNRSYPGNFENLWKEGCQIIPGRESEKSWCLINTDASYNYMYEIDTIPKTYVGLRYMGDFVGTVHLIQEPNY